VNDGVLIAIVGCVQAVIVALVGVVAVRVGRVRRDTEATRDHVVNDHKTNMREENDSRHGETLRNFAELRLDLGGIRDELRGLRSSDRALDRRMQRIEDHHLGQDKS
jgi:hypothetical protein